MTQSDAPGRDRALERVLAQLVCGAELDGSSPVPFPALLETAGVAPEDRDALLAQGAAVWRRYRRHLAGTLRGAVARVAPLTVAHLGTRLDDDLRFHVAEHGLRSRYLREVVDDFIQASLPIWEAAENVPDFVPDLARYETARAAVVAALDTTPAASNVRLDLAHGLRFIEACRLGSYRYRVNQVSFPETEGFRRADGSAPERPDPGPAPEAEETLLLLYRDQQNQAQCLKLSPFAYIALERLMTRETLGTAVKHASRKLNQPLTASIMEGTATVLAELAARGILLGPAIS